MIKEFSFLNLLIIFNLLILLIFINMINLNPIMILINLITFSFLIALKISLWKSNFLYSIILFLIMISGLLIIFLYFSSLISNVKIDFKFNKLLFLNFLLNYMIFLALNNYLNLMNLKLKKINFLEIYPILKFNEMSNQNILNFYTYPISNFTITSILFLLISLFMIIKICSSKSHTLRKIY
uniref:NADH dehydrogenase subunit 6 n=1 Tax=Acropyga fuhrmanni TaxID=602205 RepID=A0A6G5NIJ9_9HYME|nr:NADH dehydrogenase subunit 6 [Acropyga fuhrmanni]QBG38605.1 NADH dehydrogenase subunit 6 [Acropyga fuhrmanni]